MLSDSSKVLVSKRMQMMQRFYNLCDFKAYKSSNSKLMGNNGCKYQPGYYGSCRYKSAIFTAKIGLIVGDAFVKQSLRRKAINAADLLEKAFRTQ
jgi:hypothetical protein